MSIANNDFIENNFQDNNLLLSDENLLLSEDYLFYDIAPELEDILNTDLYNKIQENFSSATRHKPIIVNSYKELCDILGYSPDKHTEAKKKREEELKLYMRYTKSGRKYSITSVIPYETCIKNQYNDILSNLCAYNLYAYLNYYNTQTGNITLLTTTRELAEATNLLNSKFKETFYDKEKKELLGRNLDDIMLNTNPKRHKYLVKTQKITTEQRKFKEDYISPSAKSEIEDFYKAVRDNYDKKIQREIEKLSKKNLILDNKFFLGNITKRKDTVKPLEFTDSQLNYELTDKDIKEFSKLLDLNYLALKNCVEKGTIHLTDLLLIKDEQDNPDNYTFQTILLSAEEFSIYSDIKVQATEEAKKGSLSPKGFSSPKGLSFQERVKEIENTYCKLILGCNFVYKVLSITFGKQSIKNQKEYYKDKVLLGKSLNKSFTQSNKQYRKDLIEDKEKRLAKREEYEKENPKLIPIQNKLTEDKKLELMFYYQLLVNMFAETGISEKDEGPISPHMLSTWDNLNSQSSNRLNSIKRNKNNMF